jgi:2-polyprenyl-3-methyl-5-hydroxy-6-metoxy-1,4-benzoquinol methylase
MFGDRAGEDQPLSTTRSIINRLGDFKLGVRLLLAAAAHRRSHPLTTSALWSAWQQVLSSVSVGDYQAFMVVTKDQIDRFLSGGWDYTEQRLSLLHRATNFPFTTAGVERLMKLRYRMEATRDGPFERVTQTIYEDPDYPVFQHVGQAFRNHVTGRGPFVLVSLANISSSLRRICDAGCGSGILLGDIMVRFPLVRGTGMDISGQMLRHTQKVMAVWGLHNRVDLIQADLRRSPWPADTFDAIISMEVLEHLPDPLVGLSKLARALAHGGYLVTSIPVRDPAPVHLHVFSSIEEVVNLHKEVGLQIERQRVAEVAPGVPNVLIAARKVRES